MVVPLRARVALDLTVVFLALVSLAIGAYEVFYPLPPRQLEVLNVIDLLIVGFFIIEFTWSAYSSREPLAYARRHWIELPAMIPVTSGMIAAVEGVPLLRGLRLVRVFRLVRLLRLAGAFARLRYAFERSEQVAARSGIVYVLGAAAVSAVVGAVGLYASERGVNPEVRDFGDALWWAAALMTTVGPGDLAPYTGVGRLVSVVLMTLSIVLSGLLTALLAMALLAPGRPTARERKRRFRVSGWGTAGRRR